MLGHKSNPVDHGLNFDGSIGLCWGRSRKSSFMDLVISAPKKGSNEGLFLIRIEPSTLILLRKTLDPTFVFPSW